MTTFPEGKLFINGALQKAEGGKTFNDISPWTGEVIGIAADASAADVSAAITAARNAFDNTDWSINHGLRRNLVVKLRDILSANIEKLTSLAQHEAGSSLGVVKAAQVDGAIAAMSGTIDTFEQIEWESPRGKATIFGKISDRTVYREAIGVVGAITPWNIPLYVSLGKITGALLAGCTVVLKPAPDTPLLGSILGELALEAGLPPGVLNVITSQDPVTAGEMLVTDPRVDLISFTGSTAVGRRIMEKGAPTLKRVFLELGGKSANIILDDAPNFALSVMQSIVCFHAGQGCAISTRLLVPRSRYAEALSALETAYGGYSTIWGNFDDPNNVMGPLISKKQLDRVMGYIELGKMEGARLLAGGNLRPDKGNGFFVEPTCFVDVKNEMRIAQEEIFGPVLVVIAFDDDEDAIRIANQSEYGLSGLISSGDVERAKRVARRIRTGSLGINGGVCVSGDMPFGGVKASGIGKEWGREGIEEFTELKAIAIGG